MRVTSESPADSTWKSAARLIAFWLFTRENEPKSNSTWLTLSPTLRLLVVLSESPLKRTGWPVTGSNWVWVDGPVLLERR